MPTEHRQYLSPEDVAELLNIPKRTVYRWRHQGTGPKVSKIGRHLRYDADDVRAWFESQATSSAAT